MLDIAWIIICTVLIAMMQAGFLCLESGLTRSKNSINVAMKNLADFGVSVMLFWLVGYALMFGHSWNGWLGTTGFLFTPDPQRAWDSAFLLFQTLFCGTAVTIISGGVAERLRFSSYFFIAILVSAVIYPVFGHWAWNQQGWLKQLGFIDFAGATVVHSVGGWVTLAVLLVVGAREGRYPPGAPARKIQGHNIPLAILGVLLLWIGWLGFNGGSTLALNQAVGGIILNTVLAGSSGMLTALEIEWLWHRHASVEAVINGCLAGLVAITANCHAVDPVSAVMIGGIGGVLVVLSTYGLEYLKIDDAVGAVPVHVVAGIWGTLALPLFAPAHFLTPNVTRLDQLWIQMQGIGACFAWAFIVPFLILKILNSIMPLRISPEHEQLGLNTSEHGASTELSDLLMAMEQQATMGDLQKRMPVEPFTESGKIAHRYNRVLDRLQAETVKAQEAAQVAQMMQQEAEAANQQLNTKLEELREFNRMATDRELRMIELKREVNHLATQIGQSPRYDLSGHQFSATR